MVAVSVVLLTTVNGSARAQAWTKPPGAVYAKLSYGSATASEQFTFDGRTKLYAETIDNHSFFDRSMYAYVEAGLTQRMTLVASLPYKRVIVRDAAFRYQTYAFGDAGLSIRYDLQPLIGWEKSNRSLAVQGGIQFPAGYTRNFAPAVGSGQMDATAGIFFGQSFWPRPAYALAGLSYRHRSDVYAFSKSVGCNEGVDVSCRSDTKPDFADELSGRAEVGYTFRDRILVQAISSAVYSIRPPEVGFSVTNPYPTSQRFLKIGGGVGWTGSRGMGLSAQVFFTPVGRNTVRSLDLFFGLEYSFSLNHEE